MRISSFIIYLSYYKYEYKRTYIYRNTAINIYFITLLFIKSLLDLTKNTSSSFSISLSLNDNI